MYLSKGFGKAQQDLHWYSWCQTQRFYTHFMKRSVFALPFPDVNLMVKVTGCSRWKDIWFRSLTWHDRLRQEGRGGVKATTLEQIYIQRCACLPVCVFVCQSVCPRVGLVSEGWKLLFKGKDKIIWSSFFWLRGWLGFCGNQTEGKM